MAKARNNYINTELDWAEEQLASWKQYVDNNPIHLLKDRISFKETKSGGMIPMVVASQEAQIKSIQDTMDKYLKLLSVVDELRQKEEQKMEKRGGGKIAGILEDEQDL